MPLSSAGPIGTKRLLASTFWEAMLSCVVAALSVCSPYRYLGERGFALFTGHWRTLQHITASPSKIGDIALGRSCP